MKLSQIAVAGLLSLALGCSSVRTGLVYREVSGRYSMYSVDRAIPLVRIQGNSELGKNLEGYVQVDSICGGIDALPRILRGSVDGHMESAGAGLSYFLTDNLSVDFGGELFHADIDMNFNHRLFGRTTSDTI
ncbi:MAG: hypothetical protein ABIH92_02120, partial [Nanoarchaeota archaeon]